MNTAHNYRYEYKYLYGLILVLVLSFTYQNLQLSVFVVDVIIDNDDIDDNPSSVLLSTTVSLNHARKTISNSTAASITTGSYTKGLSNQKQKEVQHNNKYQSQKHQQRKNNKPKNEKTTTTPSQQTVIQLIHVINTYTVYDPQTNQYRQPFDQWTALQSIERAVRYHQGGVRFNTTDTDDNTNNNRVVVKVTVSCVMFDEDRRQLQELVRNADVCHRTPILPRSTKTEYHSLFTSRDDNHNTSTTTNTTSTTEIKELPFLQDMLDVAIADYQQSLRDDDDDDDNDKDDDFFVMITNSDIGLTKHFYQNLIPKLVIDDDNDKNTNTNKNRIPMRTVFSINRLTIPMTTNINEQNYARYSSSNLSSLSLPSSKKENRQQQQRAVVDELLQEIDHSIYSKQLGENHPGYDCFVIHSSILQIFDFGHLFAGHPPWGKFFNVVFRKITATTKHYKNYKSSTIDTFHVGNDRSKWLSIKPSSSSSDARSSSKNHNTTNTNTNRLQQYLKEQYGTVHDLCPSFFLTADHPYTYLNTVNCGTLWNTTKRRITNIGSSSDVVNGTSTGDNDKNNDNGNTITIDVPNYIRPGYETVYHMQQQQQQYNNERGNTNPTTRGINSHGRRGRGGQRGRRGDRKDRVGQMMMQRMNQDKISKK